ncbi:MAG: NAD-dependent epimerase/dehydratase family protein [Sporocytophaga sp.]|uniref:NAD-dependent epimerase/dehydratase family protein n=1 Tax=Sporocytophaga sp. TaxID=2231183 RepID=UPI001B1C9B1A|nr:NAD-dependent epimerase/dehydratase family protein [Sporocytophaga sp.]MBO9700617.1 NAD-dependent epimerase/dehydratase family protein [Sporocytophaga sp.]
MGKTSLITGVNGHLGNNLLRYLLDKGETVIGTVRNLNDKTPFKGLDFAPVYVDLNNKASLLKVLQGVDTLYQVAAVFKQWTTNSEKDIYDSNMNSTRNILEAAAESGVRKIVYVSSIAAMGRNTLPVSPDYFNDEKENVYYKSKIDSEKLAWELAEKYKLNMVVVCPSAMIGPYCTHLTPSHNILRMVLNKEVFTDTQFYVNWVNVKDVAEGCYLAAQKGVPGERYGLGTKTAIGITEVVNLAQKMYPKLNIKTPPKMPRWLLHVSAASMEFVSKLNKKEPMLLKSQVRMYFQVRLDMDISKSERHLGYKPTEPEVAIQNALEYLYDNKHIK